MPPPNCEPLGRYFEQALRAVFIFGLLEPPGKPVGGFDPLGPPVGGVPPPKVGMATPCFFIQLSNFLIDVALDFFAKGLDDAEATPPLAANTAPERARASNTPEVERNPENRFVELFVLVIATVWRANLDDGLGQSKSFMDAGRHGVRHLTRRGDSMASHRQWVDSAKTA